MLSEVTPGLQRLNREASRDEQVRSRRERHPPNCPTQSKRTIPSIWAQHLIRNQLVDVSMFS
jgi:hypothetical protein